LKVLVVAEYYPREGDPVLGVWAHRQALAARDAGAEVRVLVLHRPIPPLAAVRARDLRSAMSVVAQPGHATVDGLEVRYVRYLSPPRPWSYGSWGAWAAPVLRRAVAAARRTFAFDLVHAHYAVPAGDAVRRVVSDAPLVISVHAHDVQASGAGLRALRAARLVIANSAGTARRCIERGVAHTRVVHLGAEVPPAVGVRSPVPTLVTVSHLIARKRHADVIAAVALLRDRHPRLRYVIVGDGPERADLVALARAHGVPDQVEFRGQLAPADARAAAGEGWLFVMPSLRETFGVAYIEAMAAGVPAIGCAGEDGPQEIAAAGGGMVLVPPEDPPGLAAAIDELLGDRGRLEALGGAARETVEREFTWRRCGEDTLAAYREAVGAA
jgi:glycosyltransferase involved in cell wall biosynthesis